LNASLLIGVKWSTKVVDAHVRHDDKQFAEARCGQICALVITLSAIVAGVIAAMYGHEIAGSVIGVGGIGGIVGTFILGRFRSHKEHKQSAAPDNEANGAGKKGDAKGRNRRKG
jgi:uncharacterized membrane protein